MSGTYKQQISVSRGLPGCWLVLLDQSGSMAEQFGSDSRSKAVAAVRALNTALDNIVANCTKGEVVRDYFQVGVVGYGGSSAVELLPSGKGTAGLLAASELEPLASFEEIETDEDDGTGNLKKIRMSKWFDPVSQGGTPMAEALEMAVGKLEQWVAQYPSSFPPVVLNITDGEPNDPGRAESAARRLCQISTTDGNVLLFSCHISAAAGSPIEYPASDGSLPDRYARWLFSLSSEIPETLVKNALDAGLQVGPGSRGFVFNAKAGTLVKFLRIGTIVDFDR